jgi:hypothetical protein
MLFHYVQEIEGVAEIKDGYNPATWMLEVTTVSQEFSLGVDFSDIQEFRTLPVSNLLSVLLASAYKTTDAYC